MTNYQFASVRRPITISGDSRHSLSESSHKKPKATSYSFEDYEHLMRHDWHGRVRGRIRQRGWDQ